MVLRITPIKTLKRGDDGHVAPVPNLETPTTVAVATAAATSAVINTPIVMLYAEEAAHFLQGGTATINSHFIAAGERLTIGHNEGDVITAKNTS